MHLHLNVCLIAMFGTLYFAVQPGKVSSRSLWVRTVRYTRVIHRMLRVVDRLL